MRRTFILLITTILAILILAACSEATVPVAIPTELITQSSPSPVPSSTVTKISVTSTTQPTSKPSNTPLVVFELPMQLGSSHLYVDGTTLLAVPGGEFVMGNGRPESPEHEIILDEFWVYSTKVTNQQFALCVDAGICNSPDSTQALTYFDPSRKNDPVVGIDYNQAQTYCSFVNGRLPSEAEWEKAARGPEGNIYPWGNTMPQCSLANFKDCAGETISVVADPAGESYYGGLQFAGNAQEWVADWYEEGYGSRSAQKNPTGPAAGEMRSVRGSGYDTPLNDLESAVRDFADPAETRPDLGFRCVVETPTFYASFCETAPVVQVRTSNGAENCPLVSIAQAPYCMSNIATTRVTFEGPEGAVIDAGACVPSGMSGQYTCQEQDLISITASCNIDLHGNPICPPNYSLEGNTCISKDSPGECLPGWSYNDGAQCCSAEQSRGKSSVLPVCPVGTFLDEANGVCLPYSTTISAVQNIQYLDCSGVLGGTTADSESPAQPLVTYQPSETPSSVAQPTLAPTAIATTPAPPVPTTPVPATLTPVPPTAVPTEPPALVCEPQDCSWIPGGGVWDPDLCCCREDWADFCY